MSSPPIGRRGTKPAETRRAEILDAAVRLFHESGYDATAVQHIAAAAGVAAGTLYLYFPSKEHVLLALHDDFHLGVEGAMQEAFATVRERFEGAEKDSDEPLAAMVAAMVDAVVGYMRADPVKTAVICRYLPRLEAETSVEHGHTDDYIAAALQFGLDEGRIQISDPQMAAVLLSTSLSMPLMQMIVDGDDSDVDRLAAQAKEFFFKALAPRP